MKAHQSCVWMLVILYACLLSGAPVHAARPVLANGDVEKFIETFPGMYRDYRQMGLRVSPQTGEVTGADKIKRSKAVRKILKDNGWNFMFWPKLQSIARGYSLIKQRKFVEAHGNNIDKFVNELNDNPWMTAEQKRNLEAFYAKAQHDLDAREAHLSRQVNADDLSLLQKFVTPLDDVMGAIVKIEWELATEQTAPSPDTPPVDQDLSTPQPATLSKYQEHVKQIVDSVSSNRGSAKTITVIKENGGRVSWSPRGDLILFDQKGNDGYYDVYTMRPDGSNEKCLTCDSGGVLSKGHKGTAEWHPSGDYIVFQSQKKKDTGNWGRNLAATPGFGRYMDIWLVKLSTKEFFQLTHTADTDDTGVLHPHFSNDGKQLTWSEMYERPQVFNKSKKIGFWSLKIANFSFSNDQPKLTNIRSFEPGGPGFYENHGLSPDGSKFLFTAKISAESASHEFIANIYQYDITSSELIKLTSEKYNEHAHYAPVTNRILWMSSMGNPTRGTDYWSMKPDGSNKQRITDFNNSKLPSHQRKWR